MGRVVAELTLADVTDMVARWQRRLELQDWYVEVRFGRARELEGDWHAGLCTYELSQRWAKLTLREPGDYPPNATVPEDTERTVIHELLHLHFAPFHAKDGTPADVAQEQAINAISRAFVSLARGRDRYAPEQESEETA